MVLLSFVSICLVTDDSIKWWKFTLLNGSEKVVNPSLILPRPNMNNKASMYCYMQTLKTFIPCVVGSHSWGMSYLKKKISDFVSISDEAFMLVTLLNYWESWHKMRLKNTNHSGDVSVPAQFTMNTKGGDNSIKRTNKNSGWTNEGIRAFSALCIVLERSRKERKEWEN